MLDKGCVEESYKVRDNLAYAGLGCDVDFFWLDATQPTDGLTGQRETYTWKSQILRKI
jgi:hypothetical protein